jgi:Uma2 family endonuclease
MSSVFPLHRYTFADYLRLEDESSTRHEFFDGEIVAMAGGTPEHAALAMAVGRQLGNQLEGRGCRVFSSDLRVKVSETGLVTYPDVTVLCGPSQRDPESQTTVLNPTVVVEITSDSSEHFDRGVKLEHYKTIPSLGAVVVVSHRECRIEVHARGDEGWTHASATAGASALIPVLGAHLRVDAVYAAAEEPG